MENKEQLKFTKTKFFLILILLFIGIGLCIDLTYIFYKANFLEAAAPSFCSVSELIDCDGVAKTVYSVFAGVPNSIWGLVLYSVMFMLLFVDRIQRKFPNSIFKVFKNPSSYIATLGLLSFLLSMILAFISLKIIHKICYLCFCTYFIDLFIAFIAKQKGFFFKDIKTTVVDFLDGAKNHFVLFIIVLIGFTSALVYFHTSMVFSPKLKKERQMREFFEAKENKYSVKGNVLGNEKADVTVTLYSDYNCPFCKVVNIMVHKAAKGGKINVKEVNYPLDTSCNPYVGMTLGGHENSCQYAKYALAAKKQGKFWGVADILFYKHPQTPEELSEYIKKAHLGIDTEQLLKDAESDEIANELKEDIQKSKSLDINATPSLDINGVVNIGAPAYDDLIEKINLAHKRATNN